LNFEKLTALTIRYTALAVLLFSAPIASFSQEGTCLGLFEINETYFIEPPSDLEGSILASEVLLPSLIQSVLEIEAYQKKIDEMRQEIQEALTQRDLRGDAASFSEKGARYLSLKFMFPELFDRKIIHEVFAEVLFEMGFSRVQAETALRRYRLMPPDRQAELLNLVSIRLRDILEIEGVGYAEYNQKNSLLNQLIEDHYGVPWAERIKLRSALIDSANQRIINLMHEVLSFHDSEFILDFNEVSLEVWSNEKSAADKVRKGGGSIVLSHRFLLGVDARPLIDRYQRRGPLALRVRYEQMLNEVSRDFPHLQTSSSWFNATLSLLARLNRRKDSTLLGLGWLDRLNAPESLRLESAEASVRDRILDYYSAILMQVLSQSLTRNLSDAEKSRLIEEAEKTLNITRGLSLRMSESQEDYRDFYIRLLIDSLSKGTGELEELIQNAVRNRSHQSEREWNSFLFGLVQNLLRAPNYILRPLYELYSGPESAQFWSQLTSAEAVVVREVIYQFRGSRDPFEVPVPDTYQELSEIEYDFTKTVDENIEMKLREIKELIGFDGLKKREISDEKLFDLDRRPYERIAILLQFRPFLNSRIEEATRRGYGRLSGELVDRVEELYAGSLIIIFYRNPPILHGNLRLVIEGFVSANAPSDWRKRPHLSKIRSRILTATRQTR